MRADEIVSLLVLYLIVVWFISMVGSDIRRPEYDDNKKLGSRLMIAAWFWPVLLVLLFPLGIGRLTVYSYNIFKEADFFGRADET